MYEHVVQLGVEWARQHADGTLNKIKVSYNETSEIEAARQDAVCTTERTTRWRGHAEDLSLHGRACARASSQSGRSRAGAPPACSRRRRARGP